MQISERNDERSPPQCCEGKLSQVKLMSITTADNKKMIKEESVNGEQILNPKS